ncbi:hypothetical protein C8J57DRAFT_1212031 [Mycena rebaudengoi]|nr:hypothetical protein C8J57DRAFT_1212031 [Mycena rebaudengoi]
MASCHCGSEPAGQIEVQDSKYATQPQLIRTWDYHYLVFRDQHSPMRFLLCGDGGCKTTKANIHQMFPGLRVLPRPEPDSASGITKDAHDAWAVEYQGLGHALGTTGGDYAGVESYIGARDSCALVELAKQQPRDRDILRAWCCIQDTGGLGAGKADTTAVAVDVAAAHAHRGRRRGRERDGERGGEGSGSHEGTPFLEEGRGERTCADCCEEGEGRKDGEGEAEGGHQQR